jgi:hypothetical protein
MRRPLVHRTSAGVVTAQSQSVAEQSGLPPRSGLMARYSRGQTNGLEVALAIHLGIYCAAAACFALGFYALLQPSRYPNSGLSAYKPPPTMVVTYLPSYRNGGLPSFRNGGVSAPTISAEAETAKAEMANAETTQIETVKPEAAIQEARAEAAKRQRAANARREKRERETRMEYAGQPSFGGYRPWF